MDMDNDDKRVFFGERGAALAAGGSLVLMAVAAGVAYGALDPALFGGGDGAATAARLAAGLGLFMAEISLWVLVVLLDVAVAVALFRLYRRTAPRLAAAAMAARLAYSAGLAVALCFLAGAAGADGQALERHDWFMTLWSWSLIVFGGHLVLLGLAAAVTRATPRAFAVLLVFAGLCYAAVHGLRAFGPPAAGLAAAVEPFLAAPMALAELALAAWLVGGAFRHGGRRAGAS
jgi:hypothetical protein